MAFNPISIAYKYSNVFHSQRSKKTILNFSLGIKGVYNQGNTNLF